MARVAVVVLLFIGAMIIPCNSHSSSHITNLQIVGPVEIDEYASVSYSVSSTSIGNISKYLWSLIPETIGDILNTDQQRIILKTGNVDTNRKAVLQVTVTDDKGNTYFSKREIRVIDSPDDWIRTWGGLGYDQALCVVEAIDNNIYITGYFENTVDFDFGSGEEIRSSNGRKDAFLMKLDANGEFRWVRTWGGAGIDAGNRIAIGPDGSIFVAGWCMECDLDPGPGELLHQGIGANDFFLSKFDPLGNLIWSRAWGGIFWDLVHGLAVGPDGSIYLGMEFVGTVDFDPGPGVHEMTGPGALDAALTKLSSNGDLLWVYVWGSPGGDGVDGVVVDKEGNLYMTGDFSGTIDFDPGPIEDIRISHGERDMFVAKFANGEDYEWIRTWGGAGDTVEGWDKGNGIAVDSGGNVYVAGFISRTADIDPGPGVCTKSSKGGTDIILCKYDPMGNFLWGQTWGGDKWDFAIEVCVDEAGNPFVCGAFKGSVDFDTSGGQKIFTSEGLHDAFVSKFSYDGLYLWSRSIGGEESDYAYGITSARNGWIYLCGSFCAIGNFGEGGNIRERASIGSADAFIIKMKSSP